VTWFAFQGLNSGKAINLAGLQEKEATAEGFHGYSTQAQAQAHPNAINPITEVIADALIADYNDAVTEGAQPGGPNNILTPSGLGGAITSAAESESGVGSIINFIKQGSIWIRAAEILLGVVILYAGVKSIVTPAGQAPVTQTFASTARNTGKAISKSVTW
jgi:hypothetical protein